ncbi:Transducin/WD40 repeat-like superfamily protein [Prunus dulcis]|uniref:Transducin/WD40 repeat-like superfamily protein n=1 Tax=Prunus dulcis TaxID=3755 RepID=A0A4Y1R2U7_PRUDU|nr:Transducin/WD40 repeat-like superfamily protein [Prunus dulcis]
MYLAHAVAPGLDYQNVLLPPDGSSDDHLASQLEVLICSVSCRVVCKGIRAMDVWTWVNLVSVQPAMPNTANSFIPLTSLSMAESSYWNEFSHWNYKMVEAQHFVMDI